MTWNSESTSWGRPRVGRIRVKRRVRVTGRVRLGWGATAGRGRTREGDRGYWARAAGRPRVGGACGRATAGRGASAHGDRGFWWESSNRLFFGGTTLTALSLAGKSVQSVPTFYLWICCGPSPLNIFAPSYPCPSILLQLSPNIFKSIKWWMALFTFRIVDWRIQSFSCSCWKYFSFVHENFVQKLS